MENTLMIGVVSLLCIFAHVPSLLLRIVPFYEKISAKDKCRLTAIYLAGLAVDFGICMWMGINQVIDVPFYKVNLIVFCIVMAVVNVQIVRGYTKVHLFVFGIVADIARTIGILSGLFPLPCFSQAFFRIAQTFIPAPLDRC